MTPRWWRWQERQIFLFFAFVVVIHSHIAHADEIPHPRSPEALQHLAAAKTHYDVREWDAAIEEYKAGARIEASPIFDYNLGQAYRQAHDYRAAIWHYQRFLRAYAPAGKRTDSVKQLIEQMQAELDQRAAKQPPTDVITDQPSTGSAVARPEAKPLITTTQPTVATPATDPAERWYEDTLGWGLSGAGLIATSVGVGFLISGTHLHDEANGMPDQSRSNDLHHTADKRQLIGEIVGAGGLALVITGAIKLAITPSSANHPTTALRLGASARSLFVTGMF